MVATDPEREVFASKILSPVGQQAARLSGSEVTGFLAMSGHAWDGGLMVVGRAVNGWTEGIRPDHLCASDEVSRYARLVQQSVAGSGECPMRWVTDSWGATEGYNTRRSAFWRCIRSVVQRLNIAEVEGADWSSHLVWSNLYKISPAGGGNPDGLLCDIQFGGCSELFDVELRTYRPSMVLFLTGDDWATSFLQAVNLREARLSYVSQCGRCAVGGGRQARCVIAVHPQGKPGYRWVDDVVAAFDC